MPHSGSVPVTGETLRKHRKNKPVFVPITRYRDTTEIPILLRALVLGSPHCGTVAVDEVQRVPELLNVLHALLEQLVSQRFVLIGSSARKLH